MSLRILSADLLLLLSLFFFSALGVAQIVAPTCNSTAAWQWTFNSLNQSPCTVLVYMMSTCSGGNYLLWQLQPTWVYPGPHGADNSNLCVCSMVGYSLFSACAACQGPGTNWITWSEWVTNCTKTLPPSTFPNPVPSEIRVPHWVLIDLTNENYWNPNQSYAVGDKPELGPGAILSPSGVSTSSSTSPTGSTSSHNSNTGVIIAGVVGGVVAVLAISAAVVVVFWLRHRSRRAPTPSVVALDEAKQPSTEERTNNGSSLPATSSTPGTPGAPIRLYDPNDPTMFPEYQGALQLLTAPQEPVPPHSNGTGSTVPTLPTSPPPGYHVLPKPDV